MIRDGKHIRCMACGDKRVANLRHWIRGILHTLLEGGNCILLERGIEGNVEYEEYYALVSEKLRTLEVFFCKTYLSNINTWLQLWTLKNPKRKRWAKILVILFLFVMANL